MKLIRDNLVKARKQHGFTQREIAKAIGVSRATYASYEIMRRTPSIYIAQKLGVVLDTPIEALFPLKEESILPNKAP